MRSASICFPEWGSISLPPLVTLSADAGAEREVLMICEVRGVEAAPVAGAKHVMLG